MKIPTLASHSEIPEQYTGIGSNISPPLRWGPPPAGTEELALICEDLDSPGDTPFVHWLVYRIPATVTELPEDVSKADQIKEMPGVPLQGVNSQGGLGYTGPNPPLADDSWHHYRFRLFALEAPLRNLRPGMTREELWDQIKNHLLQDSELVARFHRKPVTQRLRKSA
ncbi:MAG: hypothetical protein A2X94_02905 [Bdellovibrionales bacterium GWB1_55_8]|nr:MAG: hypothetical protein A2X94_02905 [Bdellovibrionales bacterium GWB1_55_8]